MAGRDDLSTDGRFVGSYSPRIDGAAKASGRADFLADVAVGLRSQGLLHAKCLRSPMPSGRITSLDTTAAELDPGVHAVLRCDDPEVTGLKPTNAGWTPFFTASYDRMMWPGYRDRRVLSDTALWAGDEVGVVIAAESERGAYDALRRARVEWEERPFVLDMWEALEPDAPILHPEIDPSSNQFPPHEPATSPVFLDRGDVDKGFAEADVVAEIETSYHNPDHGCLDTRGCIMQWDGDDLTCWTSFYQADQTRMSLATMLDIPLHRIRVMNPYIGGNFGRGNQGDQPFLIFTALLAKRCAGRPVMYRMSRREDFHDTRTAATYRLKAGARADGTIVALHSKGWGLSGAYADHTMATIDFVPREFAELTLAPIPNLRMEARAIYTNTIPGGVKRGIGNNEINLAFGQILDMLGEKLGMDPVEIARKNCGHEWGPAPDASVTAVLREGAAKIGWERRTPPPADPIAGPAKKRGIGFSIHNTWHAAWQELPRGPIQVRIKLNPDGSVVLDAPTAETGTGSSSCNVFACADALDFLGVTPADIHYIAGTDTERGLKDQVQTDSAVSYVQAEIMHKAAARLKETLIATVAEALDAPQDAIEVRKGVVYRTDRADDEGQSVKSILMSLSHLVPIVADVAETLPEQVTGCPFLASFVEVEVDTETGEVEVLNIVQTNDCGKVMYRAGAEGQLIGGQAMAKSETLFEEIVYDQRTGLPLNFNWVDYRIATMADAPPVDPILLEVWEGAGVYPACGIGESVTTCAPCAIANAVYNAIGVRLNELPITPDKVLRAIGRIGEDRPRASRAQRRSGVEGGAR
jgi:CO/xanthine dehydrogenase Mo-binding subunit